MNNNLKLKINWYLKTRYQPSPQLKSHAQAKLQKLLAKLKRTVIIDITIVSKERIKKLNLKYRHISQATDVLTFPLYRNIKQINTSPAPIMLGEIVLCPAYLDSASDQAMVDLIVHGARHLIGRHHR